MVVAVEAGPATALAVMNGEVGRLCGPWNARDAQRIMSGVGRRRRRAGDKRPAAPAPPSPGCMRSPVAAAAGEVACRRFGVFAQGDLLTASADPRPIHPAERGPSGSGQPQCSAGAARSCGACLGLKDIPFVCVIRGDYLQVATVTALSRSLVGTTHAVHCSVAGQARCTGGRRGLKGIPKGVHRSSPLLRCLTWSTLVPLSDRCGPRAR